MNKDMNQLFIIIRVYMLTIQTPFILMHMLMQSLIVRLLTEIVQSKQKRGL